jgi:hypothetical protein
MMSQMGVVLPAVSHLERFGGRDGEVFLNGERAKVWIGAEKDPIDVSWYLDIGASNQMTSSRDAFSDLDTNIVSSMRFSDNSVVDICGCGTVVIAVRGDEHRTLTDVYYIPGSRQA